VRVIVIGAVTCNVSDAGCCPSIRCRRLVTGNGRRFGKEETNEETGEAAFAFVKLNTSKNFTATATVSEFRNEDLRIAIAKTADQCLGMGIVRPGILL